MSALDTVLGIAELVAVPVSLIWLGLAYLGRARRYELGAWLLAAIVALTVAQPFGLISDRVPPTNASAEAAVPVAKATTSQSIEAFGTSIGRFRVYRVERRGAGLAENNARATLKVRFWIWPGILTNATKVTSLCSGEPYTACWEPARPSSQGESRYSNTLAVRGRDDSRRLSILNPDASAYRAGQVPASFEWRLRFGLASPAGAAYWLVLGILAAASQWRRGRRPGGGIRGSFD